MLSEIKSVRVSTCTMGLNVVRDGVSHRSKPTMLLQSWVICS